MKSISNDNKKINDVFNPILGMKAWGVKIGQGSFLTIEFGNSVINKIDSINHGEWHLWVYMSCWRIEKNGIFFIGSEDSKDKIKKYVQKIEGCHLQSIEVCTQSLDLKLIFNNELVFKSFSVISADGNNEDSLHWMFYMPNNEVFVAGPGNKWIIENDAPT